MDGWSYKKSEGKEMEEIRKIYDLIEFDALIVLEFEEGMLEILKNLGKMIRQKYSGKLILSYGLNPTVLEKGNRMVICIEVMDKGLVMEIRKAVKMIGKEEEIIIK